MVDLASSQREHIGAGVLRRALLLLPLCGCFVDPGRYGSQSDTGSTSTGDPAPDGTTAAIPTTGGETTAPAESGEIFDSTTTGDDTSDITGDPTSEPTSEPSTATTTGTTADPTGATTMPATTGLPPQPVCGNGILEEGESCDAGMDNGGEDCTANCAAPSCDDSMRNQGESDVDCGGPCMPCDVCRTCSADGDCSSGLCLGLCTVSEQIFIDYLLDCAENSAAWPVRLYLPEATYSITADGGGGSNTLDPSYGWLAQCQGFDLGEMSVPFQYPSAQMAYEALPTKQIERTFPGDDLRCGLVDPVCDDNLDGVKLTFTSICK